MSFILANSHCEGSVVCLFLIQGVVCSLMLPWLHLKLEGAMLVFEILRSTKAKEEL